MSNQKHMTQADREHIEAALQRHMTFKEIAKFIGTHPTTISREVKKHLVKQNATKIRCKHVETCKIKGLCKGLQCRFPCRQCQHCHQHCKDFEQKTCEKIQKAPFVCNGCEKRSNCRLEKQIYRANTAQREYRETLVSSREGIDVSKDDFQNLDSLISPLIKRGQSIAHICAAHSEEIHCTERTIYNYFDKNYLSVGNLDLPRKVRYKKRKKSAPEPKNYAVRDGRTHEDLLRFVAGNPDVSIVEMDTVEGIKGGKVLLTMLIRSCRLQLAFLMEEKTQANVQKWFDWLHERLGAEVFRAVFGVVLTDNGGEFLDPLSLELGSDGTPRTRIFFCDPNCSYQKGMLEKNHEFIRYVLPKGTSFNDLTDDDIPLVLNHINSLCRDSLNGKSPLDLAEMLLPTNFLAMLGFSKVPPSEVLLKPQLLK